MKNLNVHYWTGVVGIGIFALGMIVLPLYFIYSGSPPAWNILTRTLFNMFACVGLIGFFVGFRNIISQADSDYEWLGTFIFSFGLAFAILTFVADSIQVGSVWVSKNPVDPTVVGAGGEGALLIYGPIVRLLTSVLLFACGTAIIKTAIIPVWTGWLAYIVSVFHLILVPTIFFMTEPSDFYSANGWNIPVAGGFFLTWILIVSIFLVRNKTK
ncbi:MAG: hypothetical protein NTV31_15625 [Bacteroidia bacterium]|nr:hypothetical protein [Bacteroidia bacterium]